MSGEEQQKKECITCHQFYPPDCFYKRQDTGRYRNECVDCYNLRGKGVRMRARYGVTPAEYERMRREQGDVCAVCKRPELNGRRLCLDHDHKSGRVRKLLCHRCNSALGLLDEDTERMANLMWYVKTHQASAVPQANQ